MNKVDAWLQLVSLFEKRPCSLRHTDLHVNSARHVEIQRTVRELVFVPPHQRGGFAITTRGRKLVGQLDGRVVSPRIQLKRLLEGLRCGILSIAGLLYQAAEEPALGARTIVFQNIFCTKIDGRPVSLEDGLPGRGADLSQVFIH